MNTVSANRVRLGLDFPRRPVHFRRFQNVSSASSSLVEATNPYLLPACYLSRPATNTDVYSASSFLQQESRHSKKRIESGKSSPPAAPLRKTHRDELGRAPAGRGQCDG
ncbi:hypothetical protein Bbelb_081990 [Branchiostoma belcheri]|nr:hypothetical protein Bbelb_081990 [Branchiostoma belcheri]